MSSTVDKINSFLEHKDNKKFHYNHCNEDDYKISSGSINLDLALGGGFPSGAHRFTGVNEGGKTSCALTVAKNFQKHFGDKGMVIYIRSEGRLSPEVLSRSGIDTSEDKFFRFDCNIFEKVFQLIRLLVEDNEEGKRYMFIIDSVDALCRIGDIDKPFDESEQVAGGALVTSVFLKKMVLPITKMGHMMILTSQVRVEVAANPYASRGGPKVKQAGGNAVKHYANFILEFQERYSTDIIYPNPNASKIEDKGNPIGHLCKIIFRKSVNEKTGATVRYPIRYGQKDGNSVWREREIIDMMKLWGYIEQKGAWISFDSEILELLKENKIEVPDKIQGENKLLQLVDENKELRDCILSKINSSFSEI
jgi:RecA/RadA recombinase